MLDLVCLGELLMDMFSAEKGRALGEVSAFRPLPGGAPANVAVSAARLGAQSAFIGKVGDDPFGHHLETALAQQGVQTQGLRFDREARTGLNFHAQIDEHTSTHLFYRNPSADMRLRDDELDHSLLQQTRAFAFGSISLIQEPSAGATRAAIALARRADSLVAFDVNYRPGLWSGPAEARERVLEFLPGVNVLKLNLDEARLLTGHEELPAVVKQLKRLSPDLCVVTLGPEGCLCVCDQGSWLVPGYTVQAVEATGCGDAFMATLLLGLVAGREDWRTHLVPEQLWTILRRANAAGALTSLKQGVFTALPTSDELTHFLADVPEVAVEQIADASADPQP